ncbi:energy transducer TonB family protein [Qipengyuania sp. 902]|uniref:energy transducer TonB family protein n=1 Tax=Qipengyuania sp. 902 TaxID=3417565 RepID=UPI003EBB3C01
MNKLSIFAMSVAVTASLLATPLASQEIVVSPTSPSEFADNVQKDLDRHLRQIRVSPQSAPSGAASVRFTAGVDGRPENVTIYRKSGSSQVDRASRRAVSRLTSLSPLPRGSANGQVIQANIIFANNEKQAERLSRQLAREESRRLASSPAERSVLALTVGGPPVS